MVAVSDIIDAFRAVAPEFDVMDDVEVTETINVCRDFVSERNFGPYYAKAVAYYAAHFIKVQSIADDDGSEGGQLTAGEIIMEKEGDLQRQYGSATGTSSAVTQSLSKTLYGRMFLHLRALCIIPVLTRMV